MRLTLTTQLFISLLFSAFHATSAQAQGEIAPGTGSGPSLSPQTQQVQTPTPPPETPKIVLPQPPSVQIVPVNILANPSINPLDQRSIENAIKNATQQPSGLGIGSAKPEIKNSQLLSTVTTATNTPKLPTSTSSFIGKLNFDYLGPLLTSLANAQEKMATATAKTAVSVSQDQKKDQLNEKITKLENAQNKIQEQAQKQKVDTIVSAVTPIPTTVVSTAISFTSQLISKIVGPSSSAVAKAVTPTGPDPVAIFQGAILQGKMAQLKLPPILIQSVALKAALGHFNNSTILTTMTNILSTPGLSKDDAQFIVLAMLQATAQPNDIPVSAVAQIAQQSTAGASTTGGVAVSKDAAMKELIGRAELLTKLASNMQTSLKGTTSANLSPGDKQAITAVVALVSKMIANLQDNLQTMMDGSMSTINAIYQNADSANNSMKQIFQSQSN